MLRHDKNSFEGSLCIYGTESIPVKKLNRKTIIVKLLSRNKPPFENKADSRSL